MIDAALGAVTERDPQQPSDVFPKRERTFSEQARKTRADEPMEPPASLVFEVVRHRGRWRTFHRNRHSGLFPDQAAAILAAKKLARKKRDLGHPVEVRLVRTDGQLVMQPIDEE
jgi:hypothetical protein